MLLLVLLATVCAFFDDVRATPFPRAGNQTAPGRLPPHAPSYRSPGTVAPNWNLTVSSSSPTLWLTASAPPVITPPPDRTATAVSSLKQPLPPSNATYASCTVNVPEAEIYWWYLATYEWEVGTLRRVKGGYNNTAVLFTEEPNTIPFDVTTALADFAITLSESYDAEWDMTLSYPDPYLVTPFATITSVVSRIAFSPVPSGSTISEEDIPLYTTDIYDVGPASVEVSGSAATSATPFVIISQYEVVSHGTNETAATQTFMLSQPYMYPYWVKGIEDSAVASGTLPPELPLELPHASCVAGQLTGSVTVLVVVDVFYYRAPNANPFRVHIESSVLGWDDYAETIEVKGTKKSPERTYESPHVEQTADGLSDGPTTPKPQVLQSTAAPSPTGGPNQHTVGTIHGEPVVVGPESKVRVGSQTLTRGSTPITVSGEVVSLDPSGKLVIGGTATSSFQEIIATPTPLRHTVGSVGTAPVVIGPSSVVVVGTETLSKGGPPITVGGKPVSLDSGGHAIIVDGTKTSQLPPVSISRPPPVLTLGTVTVTGNAATQYFLAPSQTLTPGGTASLGGSVISLDSSASFVVVDGATQLLSAPPPSMTPPKRTIVVGASTFTEQPGSSFVLGTKTLILNGTPVTIGTTTLSLGQDFVLVNGRITSLGVSTLAPARPEITLPGSTITASGPGTFVVDGKTVVVGGQPITLNGGITLSLAASNVLVSDGISTTLENPSAITLGHSGITSNKDGVFVIEGHTLTVGGPAITLSGGGVVSLLSSNVIAINGETSTFAVPASATPSPLTVGNRVFTALPGSASAYLLGTRTLTPGGSVVYDGTTISLAPGATAVVIDGVTSTLTTQAPITNAPILTIGLETFTAISGTAYLIHGQTLTPGGSVIFDGTTVRLSPDATILLYVSEGTSTKETLFPATAIPTLPASSHNRASAHATFSASTPTATSQKSGARAVAFSGLAYGLLFVIFVVFTLG